MLGLETLLLHLLEKWLVFTGSHLLYLHSGGGYIHYNVWFDVHYLELNLNCIRYTWCLLNSIPNVGSATKPLKNGAFEVSVYISLWKWTTTGLPLHQQFLWGHYMNTIFPSSECWLYKLLGWIDTSLFLQDMYFASHTAYLNNTIAYTITKKEADSKLSKVWCLLVRKRLADLSIALIRDLSEFFFSLFLCFIVIFKIIITLI